MRTISAPVGLNGRNIKADVITVQELLNDARESDGLPPIAVDGVVGPQTIGAIRAFQQARVGINDGRVDPNGPTLAALNKASDGPVTPVRRVRCGPNELGGGDQGSLRRTNLGFVGLADRSSIGPETGGSGGAVLPRDEALANKNEALAWVAAALAALQVVRTLMQTGTNDNMAKLQNMLEFQALCTHFHLDRHPNPLKFLSDLGRNYSLISIALNGADKNFENDFVADDFANSDPGGFARRNDSTNPGRMFFCMKYLKMGPLSKVATILHEAGHYIDSKIDHFASAVPFPTGRALTGTNGEAHTHNYQDMTPDEAFLNAASYAGFAIHCAKRADTRPVVTQ